MDSQAFRYLVAALCAVALVFAAEAGTTHAAENGKIAFVHVHANENADIYIVNADGTGLQRLTNNEVFGGDSAYDSTPSWSPDGRKMLFQRYRGEDEAGSGVFTMNADGSDLTQLGDMWTWAAGWLPDGRVAFQSLEAGDEGLFAIEPDGSDRTRIGPSLDTGIVWSPAGDQLAYTVSRTCCGLRGYDIYTRNPDGSGERRLVEGGAYPVWRPGTKIAFLRDASSGCCSDIYTINSDGTGETRLTDDNAIDLLQSWSPDGRKLVFISDRNREAYDVFDVFTINADGTGLINLTAAGSGSDSDPVWSPDGKQVAFVSPEGVIDRVALHTVDADGTHRTRLTDGGAAEESDNGPSWQPLVRTSFPSAAAFCRAHREAVGQSRFASRWGANRNGANAFGKCVSSNP